MSVQWRAGGAVGAGRIIPDSGADAKARRGAAAAGRPRGRSALAGVARAWLTRAAMNTRPLLLALLLPACGPGVDEPLVDPCADAPTGVEVVATGFAGTEGIAFSPDGRMFVGDAGQVAEVQPDGTWSYLAAVPGSIGMAWWWDRLLVAASDSGLGDGLDGVYSVDVDTGEVTLLGAIPGANFVTVTPWDTLLVSDPGTDGLLEQTADGQSTAWEGTVTSPNGIGFTPDDHVLWAVTTFADPAPVWRIPVDGEAAGTPEIVHEYPPGNAPDGIAVGASGDLYIALNIAGQVDRVAADGTVTVVGEGVDWAASLAFGVGDDWDVCSVYATSLFGSDLYRVAVGELGLPPHR